MRLQLNVVKIREVKFGPGTAVKDGTLYVDRGELEGLLLRDRRFGRVSVELAAPGESCRILQVADVVEPRAKVEGSADFPGVLDGAGTAGDGITRVLRGVAVVTSNQMSAGHLGDRVDETGSLIDMSGPAAEMSPYGKTHNVVVVAYPAAGATDDEYKVALKLAGVKAAVFLAQAARNLPADEVEVYDLPALPGVASGMEHLPRIAYIYMVFCTSYPPLAGEPVLYGDSLRQLLPTIVHPNEVLDGAIINPYEGIGTETYVIQNHPVITELYRRHGVDLCFAGVILTVSRYTEPDRERSAAMAAGKAKFILGADGVIITKASSGAPDIDASQTAQRCADLGMKPVLIMFDRSSDGEIGAVFNLPGASSIVATANQYECLILPAVKRVIGRPVLTPGGAYSNGEIRTAIRWIRGCLDQEGHSFYRPVRY